MKSIRHIQQWDNRSCVAACLLMMCDFEVIDELRKQIDLLYKRSANIHAACSLLSIKARSINVAAGNWMEEGGIYLVFAIKEGQFHAVILDLRDYGNVAVYDPARGWNDGEFVWGDPEPCSNQRDLRACAYMPMIKFTDRVWYTH